MTGTRDKNLEACEKLANEAAAKGAKWIVLPEFFYTKVFPINDILILIAPITLVTVT